MSKIELNSAQAAAVKHQDGPMLVVAGAGTGKTRVITERIVNLINEGVKPDSIVALTFTEKAATEMLDRVNESRGKYSLDVNINTYNAFGGQLLRRYGIDIGLQADQQLLNETSMAIFIREHLDEFELDYYKPIGDPGGYIQQLIKYFSELKQNAITAEDYEKVISKIPTETGEDKLEQQRHQELLSAFRTYIQLGKKHGVIDYDDQIYLTLEILRTRPNVLAELQKQYQYLLVDEFQDTNKMQSELLDLLVGENRNIMVVGDDDQAIYGFRGANLNNILEFKERYADSKEVVLNQNYRSTQAILDHAYQLINHNNPHRLEVKNQLDKQLKAQSQGAKPELQTFEKLTDELSWIAEDVKRQIKQGSEPNSIAILVRKNALATKLSAALSLQGVDNHISGLTHDLLNEPVISSIIATLRAVTNPNDNLNLYHALSGSVFEQYSPDLSDAAASARSSHQTLLKTLKDSKDYQKPLKLIESWRKQASKVTTGELIYQVITESGLKDKLISRSEQDGRAVTQLFYLSQLFDLVSDYEASTTDKTIHHFVDNLELLTALSEHVSSDQDFEVGSGVSIMTIHKAKGLEWDHVYLPDLTQGSFPGINRSSGLKLPEELVSAIDRDEFLREERRLMYVAMTRARQSLTLSLAYDHGGKLLKKPSIFLEEIFEKPVETEPITNERGSALDLETNKPKLIEQNLPAHMLSGDWLTLSVSQINDYQRCPADFYYRHVLNVPEAPSSAAGVGRVVHDVIQRFNEQLQQGQQPNVDKLLKLISQTWPDEGYGSKTERDDSLKRAQSSLKSYFTDQAKAERHPNVIEKSFEVKLEEAKVTIKGRFDAVYDYQDYVEIRDYKTSQKAHDKASAKRSATASPQLTLYALAWQEMTGKLPDKLSLDYVLNGVVGSVTKQPKSIETMTTNITKYADNIRDGKFPLGRDHTYCRH